MCVCVLGVVLPQTDPQTAAGSYMEKVSRHFHTESQLCSKQRTGRGFETFTDLLAFLVRLPIFKQLWVWSPSNGCDIWWTEAGSVCVCVWGGAVITPLSLPKQCHKIIGHLCDFTPGAISDERKDQLIGKEHQSLALVLMHHIQVRKKHQIVDFSVQGQKSSVFHSVGMAG